MSPDPPPAAPATPATPSVTPMSLAEAAQLRLLDPQTLTFFQVGATLRLTIADDCSYRSVVILRSFPLSHPDGYYSLRDGGGKEIGVLVQPQALPEASRALVEAAVQRRYLVPVITRILAVQERFGTVEWRVTTDRGDSAFTTRDLRESVITRGQHYLLTDVEGNRYAIPNLSQLDAHSRERLLAHL